MFWNLSFLDLSLRPSAPPSLPPSLRRVFCISGWVGAHYKCLILLPPAHKCHIYSHTSLHLAYVVLEMEHRASGMLDRHSTNWAAVLAMLSVFKNFYFEIQFDHVH